MLRSKMCILPSTIALLLVLGTVVRGGDDDLPSPAGWRLVWSDSFEQLDTDRWNVVTSHEPTNNSQHAYLATQVAVKDGKLIITAEDAPAGELPYRSGQVISKESWRCGRWEVRAKLPTSTGMWPAIWLLPDLSQHAWPSGGEIDILENRGNQPQLVSSAFHYGSNPPYRHEFVTQEYHAARSKEQVNYHNGFHTYAVDWSNKQLRFYVDDVHHYTVYDEDVGGFLSQNTAPMQLLINNAIGGDFLPNPDATTVWPQQMLVDWVRVYEQDDERLVTTLRNGGFEENGGSLAGWSVFGNAVIDNSNVSIDGTAVDQGTAALKVFGQFNGSANESGVAQGIGVVGGQTMKASLKTHILSSDSIAGTENRAALKVEFYNEFGAKFGTPAMIGVQELTIANAETATDTWVSHSIIATAPKTAVEARVSIAFEQPGAGTGAIYVDSVEFQETTPPQASAVRPPRNTLVAPAVPQTGQAVDRS